MRTFLLDRHHAENTIKVCLYRTRTPSSRARVLHKQNRPLAFEMGKRYFVNLYVCLFVIFDLRKPSLPQSRAVEAVVL